MNKTMKKVGFLVSLYMGLAVSFILALVGIVSSGHFTVGSFLSSYIISAVIAVIIGLIIPMKRINDAIASKIGKGQDSFIVKAVQTLVSDIIYTPFLTAVMINIALAGARAQVSADAQIPSFWQIFPHSLILEMIVGFVVIYLLSPLFTRIAMKQCGINKDV